jgi:hypothetical protein
VARFDLSLTVCTMRYVSDLRTGRINPQHFKFDLSVEQKKFDLAQFLRDRIMTTSKMQAALDEVEPPCAGTANHLAKGAWRYGKRCAFPTSPHPRRRLRTKV